MFFRRFLGLVVVSLKRVTSGIKYDFCRCDGAEQVGFARNRRRAVDEFDSATVCACYFGASVVFRRDHYFFFFELLNVDVTLCCVTLFPTHWPNEKEREEN